jgi:oligogalacturonide lyase
VGKGDRFPPEGAVSCDPQTGVAIRQLTNHRGHSHHLYFTNSGWYDGGRRLLFGSDRANASNLYSIELESGEITQVTDAPPEPPREHGSLLFTSLNPRRNEAYFWRGRTLRAVSLDDLDERVLYQAPAGFLTNMTSVTADGRFVCTGLYQDLSSRFPVDLLNGYVGFNEYWEARPLSSIVRIDTATGAAATVFEERYWIGHCNASPSLPRVATFCHEGPWDRVDHRIWGLDLETGRTWKIRPVEPGERVGHEYWLVDGEHVAYHGRRADGQPFHGRVRFDGSSIEEASFSTDSIHFHSNSLDLIVGDGSPRTPKLMLWSPGAGGFVTPRILLTHRGSFHVQLLHVHPRLSADGRQVLFASDRSGYGNLYLADIPPLELLPAVGARS